MLPEFLRPLFRECELEEIDVNRHSDFIMARVMERGNLEAMRWLRKTYESEEMISFMERRGRLVLPLRELNYWVFVAGVSDEKRRLWLDEAARKKCVWRDRHAY